jgi:L-lactate utilization protein LutC
MATADNPSREQILDRIRHALLVGIPPKSAFDASSEASAESGDPPPSGGPLKPGSPTRSGGPFKPGVGLSGEVVGAPPFRQPLAKGGSALATIFAPISDPFQRFTSECKSNLTELVLTDSRQASALALQSLLRSLPVGEVFVQDAPVLREMLCNVQESGDPATDEGETTRSSPPIRSLCWSSAGSARESSQACVTLAEALIAQTGSIMVSSALGGRRASIVPPCHIVFATRNQIVPDIDAALAQAERRNLLRNSYFGLITGSSRTADIEKILVLGAHGPMRVVIVLEG